MCVFVCWSVGLGDRLVVCRLLGCSGVLSVVSLLLLLVRLLVLLLLFLGVVVVTFCRSFFRRFFDQFACLGPFF